MSTALCIILRTFWSPPSTMSDTLLAELPTFCNALRACGERREVGRPVSSARMTYPPPPTHCTKQGSCGCGLTFNVIRQQRNRCWSPIRTTLLAMGSSRFSASSIGTGAIFSPVVSINSSFLRPVMYTNPSY